MISDFERKMMRTLRNYVSASLSLIPEISENNLNNYDGHTFACVLLARLNKSFNAVAFLFNKEYFLESNTVCRFIFEQECYALEIFNKDFDSIRKIKVTESVRSLKLLFKEYSILYGILSKYAHFQIWNISVIANFRETPDGYVEIYEKEYERTKDTDIMLVFIVLVIMLISIIDYISKKMEMENAKK